ncbi:MAG: wax ester/triacylglycerol synthase family O-acyltransferase [Candidatus Binatia bacterium]|nr:wax ester/triacylglycerol synthase family O-acyltransferase [Candidatus Binatia bacterium]
MPEVYFPKRMGPIDAMFWSLEKDRRLRTTAIAISIFDQAPDREGLREILHRATQRIPRLRQRVIEVPGGLSAPVWHDDPDFALEDHLRFETAPDGGAWSFVLDLAAAMAAKAFDRSRPLWEFAVVEQLKGGQAALVQKLHHSVGDGAAGVALMSEIYQLTRHAPTRMREHVPLEAPEPYGPEGGALALAAEILREDLASAPATLLAAVRSGLQAVQKPIENATYAIDQVRAVSEIMRSGPGPLSPIMRGRSSRSTFAALTLPTAQLKAAAAACDSTLNDALLAALASGLNRYHVRKGAPADGLRAAIPISVRDASGALTMGNRLAIGRFTLPCGERSARERMAAIHRTVQEQREPASLAAFEALATLVNFSPTDLILPLILEEMLKSDVVATAVTGPPAPLYLAGSRVESLFGFGPTAGAALNVTLMSYLDEASVAFTIDSSAVSDPEQLIDCMEAGFGEIVGLVRRPAASSRT